MRKSIYDNRYKNVIRRLRKARTDLRLTQQEVADRLGWHRTMVSNAELADRRLDILETHTLCLLYGLRLSDLEPLLNSKGGEDAADGAPH